jgi:hypothetical protein
VLFLNQTPYRYSLVEVHTTGGLPFINYLPDSATLWAQENSASACSRRNMVLAASRGIRGGTVPEILGILAARNMPVAATIGEGG